MIWYNAHGLPFVLVGALLLSGLYVAGVDINYAVVVAVTVPALAACVVDRVPQDNPYVHFSMFLPGSDARLRPGMKVSYFVGPVALWCVVAAVL